MVWSLGKIKGKTTELIKRLMKESKITLMIFAKISTIQARRQYAYMLFVKNIHDHILEASYKRKYLGNMELDKEEKDTHHSSAKKSIIHMQKGEIPYGDETDKPNQKKIH